eukprot:gene15586-32927_t
MSLYGYLGENIYAGGQSAAEAFDAWKNSPGHNTNMLRPQYNYIGIGIAYNGNSNYGWYWTNDFASNII